MSETIQLQSQSIEKVSSIYSALRHKKPITKKDLKNYIKVFLGLNIPDKKICLEHSSPMDYLWHAFRGSEAVAWASSPCKHSQDGHATNSDCIVWANRAGGKTELAAIATLLDCIFKPQCQVRILAGSCEQASKMYDYILDFLYRGYENYLDGTPTKTKCRFKNGSSAELLTQSATSVRGQHIQKLRCDEVELFEEDVYNAAKFTTQSKNGIIAGMELISTMHQPYGLMHKIVTAGLQYGTPIFKWCIWETIENCIDRNCSQCPLWQDCRGKAKNASGYLSIDDCITQMRRASRAGWEAEMLCKRPSRENVVFDEFNPAIHVKAVDFNPDWPLYRTLDFGFVNPFVCLWIQVDEEGRIFVIDEYIRSRATIDVHASEIKSKTPIREEKMACTFCDPAGQGVNDVTGTSTVRELRSHGIEVRFRKSGILEGIELIRRAIRAGDGKSSIVISPRCRCLIEAMESYHYPQAGSNVNELPLKDGVYDHPIDALRYFFINHTKSAKAASRRY
ncbi:MAG: hypothetical protein JW787_07480 [Sedimentisphaerales bacterium]|nr:hypothetical protein [Sedimentisphaerales bacterium]